MSRQKGMQADLFVVVDAPSRSDPYWKRDARRLLQQQRDQAMADLPLAVRAVVEARENLMPLEEAFWAAHRELEAALENRPSLTKLEILGFYDRRVEASHACGPYRVAFKDAERWLKVLQKELRWFDEDLTAFGADLAA